MNTTMQRITEQQARVEEYASYSLSKGGLGKVLGGVIGIVIVLMGTLVGAGTWTGILTIALTLIWLFGKEIIRTRLYRPFGQAVQNWSPSERQMHVTLTGFVALISLLVVIAVLITGRQIDQDHTWIYLFFTILMPVLTWFFLRTPIEFVVGVFLLAACAIHGSGGAYSLIPADTSFVELAMISATWSPFLGSIVLIRMGWQEHQRFQSLKAQLGSAE